MKTYYVYLLTDPTRDNAVFYCGKGTSDRWTSHLGHWSGNGKNNPTENRVKKIQRSGHQPGVKFLYENLTDEKLAYKLEEDYIRDNFDSLTNVKIDAKPPSAKGRPGHMRGKKHKPETKEKIRQSLLGQKRGPYPEEWRKAISKSLQGEKHPMYGKPSNNRKPIKELTTGQIFTNQLEASAILGVRQGDIANCLKGRQKSAKGYRFEYE